MKLARVIFAFVRKEKGAVAVDWIVITAAVVGIALAATITLGGATDNYSDTVASTMTSRGVSSY